MLKNIFFVLIFCFVTLFKFSLIPITFHKDLLSQAAWGEYIYYSGSKGFYSHDIWTFSWPNHPPLTNLYYGYSYKLYRQISLRLHQSLLKINKSELKMPKYIRFVNSFDELASPEEPFPLGFLFSLKIFPIIFDLLIAILIFILAKNYCKKPFLYLLIYLISPFSWYISSLWGQSDQISSFLTIVSFILLSSKPIISILLFYLGISIKPTSIFLLPLFLFILFKNKIDFKKILIGGSICLLINFFIFKSFTESNLYDFIVNTLLPRLFDRPPRLTTNAYNFWHIFALDKGLSDQTKFLFVPASIWSWLFFIIINFLSFKIIKIKKIKSVIAAIFTVSFGSWLFLTNMLDRYSFLGILSALILSIYYPKIFKYWFFLSVIYWLNLFRSWWFPEFLSPLRNLLTAHNYIAGLFLSIGNTLIYFKIIQILLGKNFWPDQVIKNNK
jgi:Gpi18-like mannosyltransferase